MPSARLCPLALALGPLLVSGCASSALDLWEFDGAWSQTATRELELPLEGLGPGSQFELEARGGDVVVVAGGEGPAVLFASVTVYAETKREAESALASYVPAVRPTGDGLTVHFPSDESVMGLAPDRWATVSYRAHIPRRVAVRAGTDSGSVEVRGPVAACEARTDHGDVLVSGATGDVIAESGSGDLELLDITSPGRIEGAVHYGTATARRLSAPHLLLVGGTGLVQLEDAESDLVEVRSDHGDLALTRVAGEVRATASSGAIAVDTASGGPLHLFSGFGRVDVDRYAGSLTVTATSGHVRIGDFEGELEVSSGYGAIDVDGVLRAVSARSGSGDVRVVARPGSAPAEDDEDVEWYLHSALGDVRIDLPVGFGCELDARTGRGEISSEHPVLLEAGAVGEKRGLRGTIGDGGATVRLIATQGNIDLRSTRDTTD